jgi:glycosyltransferase involved in cell wall biosynthesis
MPVYNGIDYDGRVQRAAECLAADYAIILFAVNSHSGYSNPHFMLRTVSLGWLGTRGLVRYAWFCLALILAALRARPHIVYAQDYFTAWPGRVAAALTGAVLVYDAHELIIPEEGFALGRRDRLFYRMEKAAVARAALIVAANQERAELMRAHYGLSATPLAIRNIAPAPENTPGVAAALEKFPGLRRSAEGVVRLVFQGYLSADRGIVASISALARLPEHFELVLVGGGPPADLAAIRAAVEDNKLGGRVIFLGRVPRDQLHDILAACDIGIVHYHTRRLNQHYCSPNKIYEYAQAGLPMVLTCQPPLRPLQDAYGVGALIGCGEGGEAAEISDMVQACRAIAEDLDGYRARLPAFLAAHRWEGEAERLLAAVNRICPS